jgi:hypothetical protein
MPLEPPSSTTSPNNAQNQVADQPVDMADLQIDLASLESSFQRDLLEKLTSRFGALCVNGRVLGRLQSWWASTTSRILWINEPSCDRGHSATSISIIALAQKANVPVAGYFCGQSDSTAADLYVNLTYSLVFQLVQNMKSDIGDLPNHIACKIGELDHRIESVSTALQIMEDLLAIRRQPQIFVIDRLQKLCSSDDTVVENGMDRLLSILQPSSEISLTNSLPIKTVLTTAGQATLLMSIKSDDRFDASHLTGLEEHVHCSALAYGFKHNMH